jgi:hypothetical protein
MRPLLFHAALVLASLPCVARASTWYVDVTNPNAPGTGTELDPYTSIQYAVDRPATVTGDTVLVRPGTYFENLQLPFAKRLTVASTDGPLATVLRPATPAGGITIASPESDVSTLRGFTITGFLSPTTTPVRIDVGRLEDCVVTGNGAGSSGNTIFCVYSGEFVRCTIAGNAGDGVANQGVGGATLYFRDCIAWGNAGTDVFNPGGPWWGQPNLIGTFYSDSGAPPYLSTDPRFWDLAQRDLHLRPGSPAIDAGTATELDPDGSRRDLGALPFDPNHAPVPARYCTGKLNSQGCVPAIASQGTASATAPDAFLITCSNVLPGRRGLLFYGYAPDATPFQGATYCVLQPTRRTGGQTSVGTVGVPCSGTFAFDFNARIQSGFDPGLLPGRGVYAQWWYVDPNDPAGFGTGLSDALCFGVGP